VEFYLSFRVWLHHRNRHAVLHQAAKFHSNGATECGNMMSYRFSEMTDAAAQYYFRFRMLLMSLPSEDQNLSANQISSTYLNSRLRYNYYRFVLKYPPYRNFTSGFHLDHLAVIGVLFCIRLPNFIQIRAFTVEI